MLTELRVHNFAIIDDLHVQFHPGFNVLTGETGAGKSIIIDAIELLLGAKFEQELVRSEAESAGIEGIFLLRGPAGVQVRDLLCANELGAEEDELVILARDVRVGGRSVSRVNGRAVAQSLLAEIGNVLIDIHGQGEHLSLLNEKQHVYLLDRYANLDGLRRDLSDRVMELRQMERELASLRQDARELARQVDMLSYQVDEIAAAALTEAEDETLEGERRRLANAEALSAQTQAILQLLSEGDSELPAALDLIGEALSRFEKLTRIDHDLQEPHDQAWGAHEQLVDVVRSLAQYGASIAYDPGRLQEVEDRLDLIYHLKRKYGDTIPTILKYGRDAQVKLDALAQREVRTQHLEREIDRYLHVIGEQAAALSQARLTAGTSLADAIETELADLRMAGARFRVDIIQIEHEDGCYVGDRRHAFDATGIDRVQFHVSANVGEPLMPLVRVASGGETARLMLALKNVLSRADETPTLIFDEIDQGIGGRVGMIVGRKLYELAHHHQVLCVTHLPQIAAYAHHHLAVAKEIEDRRTVTRLRSLEGSERAVELAAMLGTRSEAGLRSAQELLDEVAFYAAQQT